MIKKYVFFSQIQKDKIRKIILNNPAFRDKQIEVSRYFTTTCGKFVEGTDVRASQIGRESDSVLLGELRKECGPCELA